MLHYRIDKDKTGKLSIPDGKKFDTLWQVRRVLGSEGAPTGVPAETCPARACSSVSLRVPRTSVQVRDVLVESHHIGFLRFQRSCSSSGARQGLEDRYTPPNGVRGGDRALETAIRPSLSLEGPS